MARFAKQLALVVPRKLLTKLNIYYNHFYATRPVLANSSSTGYLGITYRDISKS